MDRPNISITEVFSCDVSRISDKAIFIYTWVVYGVVCQIINVFGIVTNIINIICFVKQGFQDSINVSLLGLAVSDIGCLITLCLTCVCLTPAFSLAELDFEPVEMSYLITGLPHMTFSGITSWITAIITLERCLCVIAPLKIKMIFTSKRTSAILACIFIIFFSSIAPVYVVNRLDMKFSSLRNKTIFGIIQTENWENVEKITFTINNFILPFVAFIIIVVCTATLVFKLDSATKWRMTSADNLQSEKVSSRNQKVAKMVVMISTLFLICFIPVCINMLAFAFEPELALTGCFFKVTIIIGGIGMPLESINSSMNIFIYYHMSTKYRDVFHEVILRNKKK